MKATSFPIQKSDVANGPGSQSRLFLPECMDVCSRECAAPESSFITREFCLVVKVSDLQSPALDGSDGGSVPVGP